MQYVTQSKSPLASELVQVVTPIVHQVVKVASEFFAGATHATVRV